MIAKLTSPLGSPTLAATTAQLRNRLPAQFRRGLPLYVAVVVFLIFIFNINLFQATSQQTLVHPQYSTKVPSSRGARSTFPNKIWQTWKVGPLAFEQRDLDTARSWTKKNPDWRYEVLTDGNDLRYVEWHYGPEGFNRPDIVQFYGNVKAAIVKADLLRYLVMYAEGGIYADIDVEALKPLSKFIPSDRYDVKDIDMVVGVEIDEPDWKDHPILGPKSRSFCQWTFMCKPQLPVMMKLVEQIMTWLNGVAEEQGVDLAAVELSFDQIISGTGPSAFTNAILAQMNLQKESPNQEVTWDLFHDLSESKVISRVLVLTVEAFAAGQGHSDSGNHEARAALVRHHYHASNWPSRHPRYSHRAYGEVEKCNWNDECVHRWDRNVAAFEKMTVEEQNRIVEEKERERKEAEDKKKKEKDETERRKKVAAEAIRKQKEEDEAARKKKEEEEKEGVKPEGPETQEGEKPKGDDKPDDKPTDKPANEADKKDEEEKKS